MPWKQNYTISDEIGIKDADVRWPDGKRCCLSLVVESQSGLDTGRITAGDLTHPTSLFGITVGCRTSCCCCGVSICARPSSFPR